MGLSCRLFLLSADDTLHALSSAAFMRMLRREDLARVPDFAGQRVRQVSLVQAVVNARPSHVVHRTFSVLNIDADGWLDVERIAMWSVGATETGTNVRCRAVAQKPGTGHKQASATGCFPGAHPAGRKDAQRAKAPLWRCRCPEIDDRWCSGRMRSSLHARAPIVRCTAITAW